jgi:hypothetical protein
MDDDNREDATHATTTGANSEVGNDDGDVYDLTDIEQEFARSLDVDDPDIEQATARLLASKILDNDFSTPAKSTRDESGAAMGQYAYMGGEPPREPPPPTPTEDMPPSERTGLLSGTPNATSEDCVALRPSIFTTVAEMNLK